MFRNTPLTAMPTFKLILGLGLCSLGGAMLYAYYKNRDEDNETETSSGKSQKPQQQSAQEKAVSIKLEVANEHIPLMLGRNGSNLSAVEEKTRTKIRLRDKDDNHKYVDITGVAAAVKTARSLLLQEIERSPLVKEEILVPQSVCGKIMGRCGEAMQEICRISMAKVSVESGVRSGGMDRRRIIITGNRQQVNIARKLIEDKIEEDEELKRAVEEVEQHREPRRSPTNSVSSSLYSSQTSLSSHLPPREKMLASKSDEKPMEVYVSAVASPSKFWVQLVGPQSRKLDEMVDTMTEYYSLPVNRKMHKIREPYLGQIVAAIFKYDSKWYRAEIVGIVPNEYNPTEVVLDLYFVDYGDSEYVTPQEVYELRTDFLTLRFQAVECFLANVKTTALNDSEKWETSSVEKFEELTQVATWKKLVSRVVTYKERPKASDSVDQLTAASREGSPIPGVELFDVIEGVEVNIGHMLISHGFAMPLNGDQRPLSPHYSEMSSSMSSSTQNPMTPPPTSSQTNSDESSCTSLTNNVPAVRITDNAEDALMQQQMQHLQKNNNTYLKSNGNVSPTKLTHQLFNGGGGGSTTTTSASTTTTTNGNFNL